MEVLQRGEWKLAVHREGNHCGQGFVVGENVVVIGRNRGQSKVS